MLLASCYGNTGKRLREENLPSLNSKRKLENFHDFNTFMLLITVCKRYFKISSSARSCGTALAFVLNVRCSNGKCRLKTKFMPTNAQWSLLVVVVDASLSAFLKIIWCFTSFIFSKQHLHIGHHLNYAFTNSRYFRCSYSAKKLKMKKRNIIFLGLVQLVWCWNSEYFSGV